MCAIVERYKVGMFQLDFTVVIIQLALLLWFTCSDQLLNTGCLMGFLKLETKKKRLYRSFSIFLHVSPTQSYILYEQSMGSQLIVLDRLYGYFTLDDDRHMSLLKPQIMSRTLDSNRVKLATNRYHRAIVQSKNW